MAVESNGRNGEPWSIVRLLASAQSHLSRFEVEEPRLCAEVLLSSALGCSRIQLYTRFDQVPSDADRLRFRDLIGRAARHEPVAYLVGHREFYSLRFKVTPDVLIPRPETERLVEAALDVLGSLAEAVFLDLGLGSGCIATAVLKSHPGVRAVGLDLSEPALRVAAENARVHGVGDRLELVRADGLSAVAAGNGQGAFDLLVSNPPYLAEADLPGVPRCVRDFEPRMALTDGADGLRFYRHIGEYAGDVLRPGGRVLVEIGQVAPERAIEALLRYGTVAHERTLKDRGAESARVLQFIRV